MKRVINKAARALLGPLFGGALCLLAFSSVKAQHTAPHVNDIRSAENVDKKALLHDAAVASRLSAVKVLSISTEEIQILTSSGTYVSLDDRYFILTTAHGINKDCKFIKFIPAAGNGDHVDCQQIIVINSYMDYAIIEVEKIGGSRPIHIDREVPDNREWATSFAALNELVYSGYPNNMVIVTVEWKVMSYAHGDIVFLHSYGWSGASGSGVFNQNGQLVGYISALLVGESEHGIDVLEDVVIVVPLFNINWSIIYHR